MRLHFTIGGYDRRWTLRRRQSFQPSTTAVSVALCSSSFAYGKLSDGLLARLRLVNRSTSADSSSSWLRLHLSSVAEAIRCDGTEPLQTAVGVRSLC